MARIAGARIPDDKKIKVALTYIYGVGPTIASKVLDSTGIDPELRTHELTEGQVQDLREFLEKNYQLEGNLRRIVGLNIKRLKEIGSYRGLRHKAGLPGRGQRTKTNARTKKGRKG